jgi:hypothetical protein
VIVIERSAFFEAQLVAVAIIAVMLEDRDLPVPEAFHDSLDDGGLARRRPAGNPDYDRTGNAAVPGSCHVRCRSAAAATAFFRQFQLAGDDTVDVTSQYENTCRL